MIEATHPTPFPFEPWELSTVLPAEERAEYKADLYRRLEEHHRQNGLPYPPERVDIDENMIREAIKDPVKRRQIVCILINTGCLSDE